MGLVCFLLKKVTYPFLGISVVVDCSLPIYHKKKDTGETKKQLLHQTRFLYVKVHSFTIHLFHLEKFYQLYVSANDCFKWLDYSTDHGAYILHVLHGGGENVILT